MDPGALFGSSDGGGSTAFVLSIALGLLGMGYFSYGKKLGKAVPLGCGAALMIFPYFVSSAAWMLGIGAVLSVLPFLLRG